MMSYQSNDHTDEPFPSMGIMQPDETNVGGLSKLIFAGAVVSVILMTWLAALYYQFNDHVTVQKNNPAPDMLGATKQLGLVLSEAQQSLQGPPRVADPKTGRIAIPITLAKQKVIAELNNNPEADVTGPPPPPPAETEDSATGVQEAGAQEASKKPAAEDNKDAKEGPAEKDTASPKEKEDGAASAPEEGTSTEPEVNKNE